MKQYVIAQHPVKATLELDDEWLRSIGVDDSDMDGIARDFETVFKQMSLGLHAIKAQKEASEAMKGGGE